MTDPTIIGFNPGGVPDRYDGRDYTWKEIGFGSAPFNWEAGFDIEAKLREVLKDPAFAMPVKDQNGSYSCGGQAWSYYAEILEALASGTFEERSAKFIYAQTYVPGGGSYGRDNCEVFKSQGVAKEVMLSSYENGLPPTEDFMKRSQDITSVVREDAKLSKALSYATVGTSIEDIAQAIRDNNGMVIGVRGQNNGTWTSAFPKPPTSPDWGHWVYCGKAKMVNGKKYIGFLNSWGKYIGENGWQWLSEEWFTLFLAGYPVIFNTWTHVFNPESIPATFRHSFNTNLKINDVGPEVVALQTALHITGDFPASIKATGFYGPITRDAVAKYQKRNSITPAVGYCGPITRGRLNKQFSVPLS